MLEEDHLELDRMLESMRQFILEKVRPRRFRQAIDEGPIRPRRAERGLEIFPSQRKPVLAILVGNTQDHEDIGVGSLDQLSISPGIDRPSATEVDMWAEDQLGRWVERSEGMGRRQPWSHWGG